jgi:hypothetical protein
MNIIGYPTNNTTHIDIDNMIYTKEMLQCLSIDDIKDIIKHKFALTSIGERYPTNYSKEERIQDIIDFQEEFGNTETKLTHELKVGDVFLYQGRYEEEDITYCAWREIVSIQINQAEPSKISHLMQDSSFTFEFDDVIKNIERLSNIDQHKIGYKLISMKIEDDDWDGEKCDTVEEITFYPCQRHIVRQ